MLEHVFIGVAMGVVVAIAIVCGGKSKRAEDAALGSPLLPHAALGDHRVEAAVRDAAEGYNTCGFCAFENFKRFPFCSLCGREIQAEDGGNKEGPQAIVQVTAPSSIRTTRAAVLATLTQRQKRARNRREWVRKLDVEGNLYWFRDTTRDVEPLTPGYCLRFKTGDAAERTIKGGVLTPKAASVEVDYPVTALQRHPSLIVESSECASDPAQSQLEDLESAPLPKPLEMDTVIQVLNECVRNIQVHLTESSASDPTQFAFERSQSEDSVTGTPLPVLDSTNQNFPVKYAEFVAATAALMAPAENQILKFNMSREFLLEDSMESLSVIPEGNIRSSMRMNFVNERGLDAGGLQREWFVLLNERLVDPEAGVFRCVNQTEQTFYLNPNSAVDIGENHLMYYFATGRLVGRALLEGQVLGFHLALPLLKIILGIPVTFRDLEYFDPEAYKSMLWIKENAGVEELGLDFSVAEKRGEKIAVVDLIENGRNVEVTDENKGLYLETKFRYLLFESVSSQLHVFLKGLYEVVPQHALTRFDPEELDYVLCGSDVIDVDDWEHSTHVTSTLLGRRKYLVKWFWEVVRAMPNEYRQRLLHFTTGSSRAPISGFSALTSNDGRLCPFTLKLAEAAQNKGYIWSHTCFNRLDLPVFKSKADLETILYATLRTELNGFTTD